MLSSFPSNSTWFRLEFFNMRIKTLRLTNVYRVRYIRCFVLIFIFEYEVFFSLSFVSSLSLASKFIFFIPMGLCRNGIACNIIRISCEFLMCLHTFAHIFVLIFRFFFCCVCVFFSLSHRLSSLAERKKTLYKCLNTSTYKCFCASSVLSLHVNGSIYVTLTCAFCISVSLLLS